MAATPPPATDAGPTSDHDPSRAAPSRPSLFGRRDRCAGRHRVRRPPESTVAQPLLARSDRRRPEGPLPPLRQGTSVPGLPDAAPGLRGLRPRLLPSPIRATGRPSSSCRSSGSSSSRLALWVEFTYEPPIWLHLVLWFALTAILSLALVRPLKGVMVGAAVPPQGRGRASVGSDRGLPLPRRRWRRRWLLRAVADLVALGDPGRARDMAAPAQGLEGGSDRARSRRAPRRARRDPARGLLGPTGRPRRTNSARVRVTGTLPSPDETPVHGLAPASAARRSRAYT